ncbi:unnamed protein product [Cyprideis torosa]|uniref:Uncharacterized protein n=1 Tax=Cyprideis torosa TaxID=163714 RepID=A0A7R8WLW7_9CRUS|nr:unnamed protein product [Cyprideis torosa]CAG0897759.1 unnamed protein product [Cyprideis torosa]
MLLLLSLLSVTQAQYISPYPWNYGNIYPSYRGIPYVNRIIPISDRIIPISEVILKRGPFHSSSFGYGHPGVTQAEHPGWDGSVVQSDGTPAYRKYSADDIQGFRDQERTFKNFGNVPLKPIVSLPAILRSDSPATVEHVVAGSADEPKDDRPLYIREDEGGISGSLAVDEDDSLEDDPSRESMNGAAPTRKKREAHYTGNNYKDYFVDYPKKYDSMSGILSTPQYAGHPLDSRQREALPNRGKRYTQYHYGNKNSWELHRGSWTRPSVFSTRLGFSDSLDDVGLKYTSSLINRGYLIDAPRSPYTGHHLYGGHFSPTATLADFHPPSTHTSHTIHITQPLTHRRP